MKVQVDILDSQLELLEKLRTLPDIINAHVGKFPQDFPNCSTSLGQIDTSVAMLEFLCKKWIFDTSIMRSKFDKVLDKTKIVDENAKIYSDYED
jgi:hypothetical protein